MKHENVKIIHFSFTILGLYILVVYTKSFCLFLCVVVMPPFWKIFALCNENGNFYSLFTMIRFLVGQNVFLVCIANFIKILQSPT